MKRKVDIFGNTPEVGDIIVFNPPKYKGLTYGTCIGFTSAGCSKINDLRLESYSPLQLDVKTTGFYSVKTEFVIKKNL